MASCARSPHCPASPIAQGGGAWFRDGCKGHGELDMAAGELDEIHERLGGTEIAIRLLAGAFHRVSPSEHRRMLQEMDAVLRRSADLPLARSAALFARTLLQP